MYLILSGIGETLRIKQYTPSRKISQERNPALAPPSPLFRFSKFAGSSSGVHLTIFRTFYLLVLAIAHSAQAGPNADVEIGFATLSSPCGLKAGDRVEFLVGARQMQGVRQIKFDFSWTPHAAITAAKGSTAEATEAKAFIAPGPPQIDGDLASYGMAVFSGDGLFGEGLLANLSFELGAHIDDNVPVAIYIDAISLGPSFAERDTVLPSEAVILANYCDAQGAQLTRKLYLDASRPSSLYSSPEKAQVADSSPGEITLLARLLEQAAFAAGQDIAWQVDNPGPGTLYALLETGERLSILPGGRAEISWPSDRRGNAQLTLDAASTDGKMTTATVTACTETAAQSLCTDQQLVWEKPTTAVEDRDEAPRPIADRLLPNYPNPFNAGTSIPITIAAHRRDARVAIFNLAGQQVTTLFSGPLAPGRHQMHWDGHDQRGAPVASGIYFYQLQLGRQQQLRRMLLLR